MYYLIGGLTGSGKTSFIDDAFVLNPVDWALSQEGRASGIKVKVWYRSMERSRTYKFAKWTSRKIFLDHLQPYTAFNFCARNSTNLFPVR